MRCDDDGKEGSIIFFFFFFFFNLAARASCHPACSTALPALASALMPSPPASYLLSSFPSSGVALLLWLGWDAALGCCVSLGSGQKDSRSELMGGRHRNNVGRVISWGPSMNGAGNMKG